MPRAARWRVAGRAAAVTARRSRTTGHGGRTPLLKIDGLVKQYRTGDRALKGIDLEVPKGEVMALIGPSGAGKSTLIRCINRLVEPTTGSVKLDGLEITGLNRADLRQARRRMGMIFQEYALVERLTVMENVLSGRLGYVPFWRSFTRRFPDADVHRFDDAGHYVLEDAGREIAELVERFVAGRDGRSVTASVEHSQGDHP